MFIKCALCGWRVWPWQHHFVWLNGGVRDAWHARCFHED